MVKLVVLEHKALVKVIPREVGYKVRTRFVKYTAENGKFICAIDGDIVSKEDGNALYRKLKGKGAVCIEREDMRTSDEETLSYIENGIDKYAHYIDDYRQYEKAEERNAKLRKIYSEFRAMCSE